MSAGAQKRFTPADYLACERQSKTKHEFFAGRIFARAGGTQPHRPIAGNSIGELRNATRQQTTVTRPTASLELPALKRSIPLGEI